MEKDSALYQLMDTRMNGVMNGITNSDGEYQVIIQLPHAHKPLIRIAVQETQVRNILQSAQ